MQIFSKVLLGNNLMFLNVKILNEICEKDEDEEERNNSCRNNMHWWPSYIYYLHSTFLISHVLSVSRGNNNTPKHLLHILSLHLVHFMVWY